MAMGRPWSPHAVTWSPAFPRVVSAMPGALQGIEALRRGLLTPPKHARDREENPLSYSTLRISCAKN